MRALGAEIDYRDGYYFAKSSGRLRGAQITFPHVTVMGTENAMLAAVLAKGTTRITPAAQEPEIDDLITLLNAMGAQVARTAPDVIEIQGVDALHGATHRVMPDRIEAGTFAAAAAVIGGSIEIQEIEPSHLTSFLELLERTGVEHSVSGSELTRNRKATERRFIQGNRHHHSTVPRTRHRLAAVRWAHPHARRGREQHPRNNL